MALYCTVLWRGTVERLQAFFQDLNAFDTYLQFTMKIGGSSLHFLDLLITIRDNKLETILFIVYPRMPIYTSTQSLRIPVLKYLALPGELR